jgi:hypothetical protein
LVSNRHIRAVAAAGIGLGAGRDVAAAVTAAGIGVESARNIGGGIALRIGALAKGNIGAAILTDDAAAGVSAGSWAILLPLSPLAFAPVPAAKLLLRPPEALAPLPVATLELPSPNALASTGVAMAIGIYAGGKVMTVITDGIRH